MHDPLTSDLMDSFEAAAIRHFGELASSCSTKLETASSTVYGFKTSVAIVTLSVYHGHHPSIMAKARNRASSDYVFVDDSRDIAAAWFIQRTTGQSPKRIPDDGLWTPESINEAVEQEASILKQYAWPYLTDPKADWDEFRDWRQIEIARRLNQNQ